MLPWQPIWALTGVLLGSSFSLTYFRPDVTQSSCGQAWRGSGESLLTVTTCCQGSPPVTEPWKQQGGKMGWGIWYSAPSPRSGGAEELCRAWAC